MHLRTWLTVAAVTTALGCGDDAGGESVSSKEETRKAALALTEAVDFEGGITRTGGIPKATAESITLISGTESLVLVPGDSTDMTMSFENPDEDTDPVDSVLLQFADSDDHIEVPRMRGDAGAEDSEVTMPFSVDDKVCEKLCAKKFSLTISQAVKLKDGDVSEQEARSFELDCSKDGDPSLCSGAKADKPATTTKDEPSGTGGKTGSTSIGATLSTALGSALNSFNTSVCACQQTSTGISSPCKQTVTLTQRDCLKAYAVTNADEVQTTIGCLNQQLAMCASGCGTPACDPNILINLPAECDPLPADLEADYLACLPAQYDKAPTSGADAGAMPAP